ncbi:uncharacterized protein Z519_07766 [Cladophialophora bantiana CBS 173.52]|uniref:Monopolin complex subunit Csm1/Pcs1 C-terminal domain-containing protein n=1 Tax=Cladophialophora bantiana (strain ATCC 10958 / CBS 173.52 / CDC B-1940 / NIH 8579) TaxID=1442370 RepID=A0A0D2EP86_CLAB1|nr:uncharacterized protein Z519_07766 [Cladophialophora bantiana CBS 173.52]KIW91796.1 hypothetical protein Z519_07766 [Cladophialophora bantiana CBS 173.52]
MKGIADLLDSDTEKAAPFIDENSILSSASDATDATAAKTTQVKRGKKRHRVTVPSKAKSKVQKSAPSEVKKTSSRQTAGVKRKAGEDHSNDQDSNGNQDETLRESEAETQTVAPKAKRGRRADEKAAAAPEAVETHENEDGLREVEVPPVAARPKHAASRTKKEASKASTKATASTKSKAASHSQSTAPEPQHEETEESSGELEAPKGRPIARDTSRTRQDPPYRRRAGSASDTERGDPNLRRKLGDITRKFENVDLKYRNLREVGINEANANMEKLRKQCDAAMQASNDLVASLRKELATHAPLAHEARKLRKQMQTQEAEMERMRETTLQLSTHLADAQNEIKGLQAKLVAARASSVDNPKPPSSAMKSTAQRQLAGEAAQAAQVAQMKEDLYSDLTGLVILNVKKTEEGDTYECIQTGRNGTLHFRLFIDQEMAKGTSFEETEYLYTPLLDRDRDHGMMKLMPSYLTEDITFARHNAAKFYGRVVDTITKKRGDE